LGNDALRGKATPIQVFETPELPRLQACDKPMDTRLNSPAFRLRLAHRLNHHMSFLRGAIMPGRSHSRARRATDLTMAKTGDV
jgi:hypothetical protein